MELNKTDPARQRPGKYSRLLIASRLPDFSWRSIVTLKSQHLILYLQRIFSRVYSTNKLSQFAGFCSHRLGPRPADNLL
jgi:hypothetical protein